ncbi:MAG TPA: 2-succinyl-5-enolpyruvyl-6-hydroxy-3-cyclohexene-1-carboxylic-acid synthase [Solirubrobacterales bacterium]|jgi:2-succinyl-5-enolpyruvyl-6-hydroxy-3-cyclohexene-1-carboxylate synthase|nr:2-succinyl-5-enolpyruvyl-6-hydroxy-3-cyclohexene-1-carboxylic-acid synthase [Solirubrobacterales bacterium]
MDPTNANTALASAFVEELARCGVHHAVLSPGSRSTPLAVALWRQPEIEVRVIVDERSAAFFALGAAQASGVPVAMLCTSGTAAANLHPAICEADHSAVPLIALTADRPPELRGIGAGQTIDQLKLYGDSVRWFCEVGTHAADDKGLLHYRATACRAFAAARGEPRPGPVHLNLPWREPLAPVPVEGSVTAGDRLALTGRDGRPLTAVTPIDMEPSQFLLDEVAGHIAEAEIGVIVAGRQLDPELREPLAHLAQAAGYPILAEPTSQLRCGPHDRSHVVTAYDLLLRDERFREDASPDLMLRFGEMPTSKPLRSWLAESGADQIVVDPLGDWNEPSRHAAALLRADPTELAAGWAARLGEDRPPPAMWLESDRAAREAIEAELAAVDAPTEPGLQLALGAAHRDGDLVYTASSMPIRDQEAFLPSGEADTTFLCNRGANGIDGLVSSGIGAAHASGRPTTIVTGDLGLLHDVGGLAALREVETPVRIVVIDNDGGGIFHFLPQEQSLSGEEFEALLGTPRGVSVARAADLFGLPHRQVADLAQLPEALAAGTGLIEISVDRQTNAELHRRIVDRVAAAL